MKSRHGQGYEDIFAAAIVVQREAVAQTTLFGDGETTTVTVTETATHAVRLTYTQN